MIDSLCWALPQARHPGPRRPVRAGERPFIVVTLHRPATVDDPVALARNAGTPGGAGRTDPVLFPGAPADPGANPASSASRQRVAVDSGCLIPWDMSKCSHWCPAHDWCITDSGGLQEETTYLGIPCLTVRQNTERPDHLFPGNQPPGSAAARGSDRRGAARSRAAARPRPGDRTLGRQGRASASSRRW